MSVLYSIRDWDRHFEKSQSKSVRSASWVPLPNKHDGKSYRRLMRLPRGMEIYGAWVLIVQVASKCPTRGVLADADGPLTVDDISDKTGGLAEVIQLALDACSDPAIGWIACCEGAGSALGADSERAGATGQDRTGHGITEQEKTPPTPKGGDVTAGDAPAVTVAEVSQAWNDAGAFCGIRPPVTGKRLRALQSRLREPHWRESWASALARARASPFCCGENDSGWKATFDWFIRPDTVTKLMEGQYDGKPNSRTNPRLSGPGVTFGKDSEPTGGLRPDF